MHHVARTAHTTSAPVAHGGFFWLGAGCAERTQTAAISTTTSARHVETAASIMTSRSVCSETAEIVAPQCPNSLKHR